MCFSSGSPHLHGVLWLRDAPDVSNLAAASAEEKQKVADYFDKLVSTIHPDMNEPKGPVHPSRIKLSEVDNRLKDLAQLLNRVQRHTRCMDGYCLRKKKRKDRKECRFKFPQEKLPHTRIIYSPETKKVKFVSARNDKRLNKYNPYIIQTWRANIDIAVLSCSVLSKQALVNYLAKYISKPEKESQSMIDLLKGLMTNSEGDETAKSILQRLYIQSCSQRDYSAQETFHLLMGLKLVCTDGINFVNINFSSYNKWLQVSINKRRTKSLIERYMERDDPRSDDKCLWYMAKTFNFSTGKQYRKNAIVQVFPKLKLKGNSSDANEEFYKQQVLLFVPWRDERKFLETASTWHEIYELHRDTINVNKPEEWDLEDLTPEDDDFEDEAFEDNATLKIG